MPFDGLFAAAVAAELNRTLTDARIHKIQQPDARTLLLHCRQPGHNWRLLISAEPGCARVHLTETQPPNPPHPPAFCMLLRKYLEPARILHVSTVGLDRIVRIVCEAVDGAGRRARLVLIAELTGRHSNIILVEEATGRILDALQRTAPQERARRALVPGATYEPPPVPPKRDPRRMGQAEVVRLLELQPAPQPVTRTIADLFDGFGPFAAREVLLRAGLDPEVDHGRLAPSDRERVASALLELAAAATEGRFQPVLVRDEAGTPVEFWAFPPLQAAARVEQCASPSAAAAAYYNHRLATLAFQREKQRLERLVAAARARLARKADNLRADLKDAERAEEYRLYGELLTANLHRVARGSSVTLPNYYAGEQPIDIPLDPSLSPAENAQRYFKRYAKARAARIAVQGQLDATLAELAYLDQVALHLDMADSLAGLAEIEAELQSAGIATERTPPTASPLRSAAAESRDAAKPLEARTTGGARVLIGRNNRQNERLTLRTARPDDIWLHVKDLPGAHVILQPQGEATDADLREAAQLAAYFSKARDSSNVAVDWTRVRNVRKPKGARPGMVIYDHHRTVYVSPDAQTVKALLAMSRR